MVMTTALTTSMNLEEAKASISRIEKGVTMAGAMDSKIGLLILDLYDRGGWMLFENDDGTQRYKNVATCLVSEMSGKLAVEPGQIKRYMRAATTELQLFGRDADDHLKIAADPRLRSLALPERTVREFARLNDWPDKQKKAWERLMDVTAGRPTAKVARQVVDTFTGDYKKRKARKAVIYDASLKKIALLLVGSVDEDVALAEDKKAPDWVLDKFYATRRALLKWQDMIQG